MNSLLLAIVLTASNGSSQQIQRSELRNEMVVAVKNARGVNQLFQKFNLPSPKKLFSLQGDQRGEEITLFSVKSKSNFSTRQIDLMRGDSSVAWVQFNYSYKGDPREESPNDPLLSQQYHHKTMQNLQAWEQIAKTSPITVAITDDGLELSHPDILPNLWTNPREIRNNGIDDDQNGYVDDVHGWDFAVGNADPSKGGNHGTHVAGIVGARLNNQEGGAGVAGWASLMPVRFYDDGKPWTSTVIAQAYAYAVNNGAKILNTSYNVNQFVGDQIFESALQYVYEKGGLHFNSAGNSHQLNPPRQRFEQLILVCSTNSGDLLSYFSNYGTGVDVCAPGEGILSTVPNHQYDHLSGTSMSTPAAAGAAALIWSVHPEWSREQVLSKLLSTSDPIDDLNPSYKTLMGSGRANTYRALTEENHPPRIQSVKLIPGAGQKKPMLEVQLWGLFTASSIQNSLNWELKSEDHQNVSMVLKTRYLNGTNTLNFELPALAPGNYRLRAKSGGLEDPFGLPLDGNNDGTGGDDFVGGISSEGYNADHGSPSSPRNRPFSHRS